MRGNGVYLSCEIANGRFHRATVILQSVSKNSPKLIRTIFYFSSAVFAGWRLADALTLLGLANVLMQLVQALTLVPSGNFTHCKLARFFFLPTGLYLLLTFFRVILYL